MNESIDNRSFGSIATMSETPHNYEYSFDPPIGIKYVEKLPMEIKDFVAKNLTPRGGGFALGKTLTHIPSQSVNFQKRIKKIQRMTVDGGVTTEEVEEEIDVPGPHGDRNSQPGNPVVLVVPKTVPFHMVEYLFRMLRRQGLIIDITTENFAAGPGPDLKYKIKNIHDKAGNVIKNFDKPDKNNSGKF